MKRKKIEQNQKALEEMKSFKKGLLKGMFCLKDDNNALELNLKTQLTKLLERKRVVPRVPSKSLDYISKFMAT